MIAHACQHLAELKMHAGIVGMQLGTPAKRLNFIFVIHFGQLVELRFGAGVFGMLKHLLRLAFNRPFQAVDLGVFIDRMQRRVVGVGLEALREHLLGLVEIAVAAIDFGQVEIGVDSLGVGEDFFDQALLRGKLLVLEPVELGCLRLGRLGAAAAAARSSRASSSLARLIVELAESALICRFAS